MGEKSFQTHINGVKFTEYNWKDKFSNKDYNCIPKQMKKLIGFAKEHSQLMRPTVTKGNYDNKQQASEVAHHHPEEDTSSVRKACKIAKAFAGGLVQGGLPEATQNETEFSPEVNKSKSGAGATFGIKNKYGGSRGGDGNGNEQ